MLFFTAAILLCVLSKRCALQNQGVTLIVSTMYEIYIYIIKYILKMKQQQHDINFEEDSEKIRVPDGIWTHDPPWSSRML